VFDQFKAAKDQNDQKRTAGIASAASDADKDTSLGGWMPSIPAGSCITPVLNSPVGGGAVTMDICQYLAPITAAFEMLWLAFFGFSIMVLLSSATNKSHA
jgi:hypothetical protein